MPKTKKPTFIMIHGFRGSHHGLLEIAEYLKDEYDILAPDIPGSGAAPELDHKTLDGYADWLHDYIEKNKLKKPYILGHSMGSMIVSHFVQKYPNDVANKVILLSPVFRTEVGQKYSNFLYKICRGGIGIVPKSQRKKLLASKQLSYIISHLFTYDKGQQKRIDQLHYQYSGRFASADSFIADMRISMREQTIIPEKNDVLLCIGDHDQLTKKELVQKMAQKYNASYKEISDVGHLVNYETPEIVANAIKDFIKS